MAPSMAGWAFHVTVVSDQAVLLTAARLPPAELSALSTSLTCTRSRACDTGSARPATENRMNPRRTGEPSMVIWVAVP